MTALLIALLFSIAEAANGPLSAKAIVSHGKLQVIPIQGKEVIYGNGETDFLVLPQTVLKSLAGTCIIKIGEIQFILDENDSLAYESENDLTFRCVDGSIEAIFGDNTRKLGRGEVVAFNSSSRGEDFQNAVSRARSIEVQKFGPLTTGSLSPTSPSPIQGVAFTHNSQWEDWYGGIVPIPTWASKSPSVSPYW